MKEQTSQTIISGVTAKHGDLSALLAALHERVKLIGGVRGDRELIRSIERAHGLVVEAAEQINLAPAVNEKLLRRLDVALVGYQRRVLLLCMNSKRRKG